MEANFLVAGLGNPGREYAVSRHNAGFLAVEELARRWNCSWSDDRKFQARVSRTTLDGKAVWICEPQTYMNASGESVAALMRFYRIPREHLLVVVDDADLAFGEIRMREKGSSGGHHGLENIESHLGTRDFARLRVGIGRGPEQVREITGYVLGSFSKEERGRLATILDRVASQAETWIREGAARAMNAFNGKVPE